MGKWNEMIVLLIIFFCIHDTFADETALKADLTNLKCNNTGSCAASAPDECQEVCGCDGIYKFDDFKGECVLDYEYLKERTKSNNLMASENLAETTEKVFQGIIYCALFFIICASFCVVSVCIFCCHIHYSDEKLKTNVETLAKKLKVDLEKSKSIKKKTRDQKEESCNVIVEDANILCV